MGSIFKSKKFWATVVGCVVVGVAKGFGADDATATKIAALVGAYVLGQGLADFGKEAKKG